MNAGWKIVFAAAVLFGLAFGAERLFVPDVVPVAYAEDPQPLWSVQVAFVLRSVELMAAGAGGIALVLMFGAWARRRLRRDAV
jgi:hypothetical protein